MNRSTRGLSCLLAVWLTACLPASAATPEQVDQSIQRAIAFLESQQSADGTWESAPQPAPDKTAFDTGGGQWGGLTALSTYALLAAGEKPRDARLQPAIHFLESAPITGIYALGLRSQVWRYLPLSRARRNVISRDGRLLIAGLHAAADTNRDAAGMYGYLATGMSSDRSHIYDHSASQYGVLGMWALQDAGLEVPDQYWTAVDAAWRRDQLPSGGWSYYSRPQAVYPETVSMTAAGVASLFLTDDDLRARAGLGCSDDLADPDIDRGLAWIGEHFPTLFDPPNRPCYGLYGIERIGAASGRKLLGEADWYAQGADFLLSRQSPAGARDQGAWDQGDGPIADTALGLLFLVHGRAPVIMNKLDYSPAAWDRRPRDLAHFARWISTTLEAARPLNWQVVSIQSPPEQWHDAPILYVCGHGALHFSDEQQAKLKRFVEEGGLILFNSDCGLSQPFVDSVRELGRALFSADFRPLPADHPIYTHEEFHRDHWNPAPAVLGVSNGARELMLLIPDADLSAAWQVSTPLIRPEAFELAANIFLYAVDKENLHFKGESNWPAADPAVHVSSTIKIARLQYDGRWDPEPGGWRRLAAIMHNRDGIDLNVQPVSAGDGTLLSGGFPIAHLTGTAAVHLTPAARDEIARFVTHGGTLIIDAAGGSTEFADSVRSELTEIFGAQAESMKPILIGNPLYISEPGRIYGRDITLRPYARTLPGQLHPPYLQGIHFGRRFGVFFSPQDLSVGLVGQPVDGIVGYPPELATRLMERMIREAAAGNSR